MPRMRQGKRVTPETLGQRIKRLRMGLALSQPELAAIVRVDHATLSRWETDKRTPRSPAIRRALADALGVSVALLMTGHEPLRATGEDTPSDVRGASRPPTGHDRRRPLLAPLRTAVDQVQRLGDEALMDFVNAIIELGERTVKRYR